MDSKKRQKLSKEKESQNKKAKQSESKMENRTENQRELAKSRSEKLSNFLDTNDFHLIIDDEIFIPTHNIPRYYLMGVDQELPEWKILEDMKNSQSKFHVWQAICQCGMRSEAYVTDGIITKEVYINECLKERLIPFIMKHSEDTLFWPDLALIHYAKETVKFMQDNNIRFVPKDMNPPKVPQCRPIGKYFSLIRSNLRDAGREPTTDESDFLDRWDDAAMKITDDVVEGLMDDIREQLEAVWK